MSRSLHSMKVLLVSAVVLLEALVEGSHSHHDSPFFGIYSTALRYQKEAEINEISTLGAISSLFHSSLPRLMSLTITNANHSTVIHPFFPYYFSKPTENRDLSGWRVLKNARHLLNRSHELCFLSPSLANISSVLPLYPSFYGPSLCTGFAPILEQLSSVLQKYENILQLSNQDISQIISNAVITFYRLDSLYRGTLLNQVYEIKGKNYSPFNGASNKPDNIVRSLVLGSCAYIDSYSYIKTSHRTMLRDTKFALGKTQEKSIYSSLFSPSNSSERVKKPFDIQRAPKITITKGKVIGTLLPKPLFSTVLDIRSVNIDSLYDTNGEFPDELYVECDKMNYRTHGEQPLIPSTTPTLFSTLMQNYKEIESHLETSFKALEHLAFQRHEDIDFHPLDDSINNYKTYYYYYELRKALYKYFSFEERVPDANLLIKTLELSLVPRVDKLSSHASRVFDAHKLHMSKIIPDDLEDGGLVWNRVLIESFYINNREAKKENLLKMTVNSLNFDSLFRLRELVRLLYFLYESSKMLLAGMTAIWATWTRVDEQVQLADIIVALDSVSAFRLTRIPAEKAIEAVQYNLVLAFDSFFRLLKLAYPHISRRLSVVMNTDWNTELGLYPGGEQTPAESIVKKKKGSNRKYEEIKESSVSKQPAVKARAYYLRMIETRKRLGLTEKDFHTPADLNEEEYWPDQKRRPRGSRKEPENKTTSIENDEMQLETSQQGNNSRLIVTEEEAGEFSPMDILNVNPVMLPSESIEKEDYGFKMNLMEVNVENVPFFSFSEQKPFGPSLLKPQSEAVRYEEQYWESEPSAVGREGEDDSMVIPETPSLNQSILYSDQPSYSELPTFKALMEQLINTPSNASSLLDLNNNPTLKTEFIVPRPPHETRLSCDDNLFTKEGYPIPSEGEIQIVEESSSLPKEADTTCETMRVNNGPPLRLSSLLSRIKVPISFCDGKAYLTSYAANFKPPRKVEYDAPANSILYHEDYINIGKAALYVLHIAKYKNDKKKEFHQTILDKINSLITEFYAPFEKLPTSTEAPRMSYFVINPEGNLRKFHIAAFDLLTLLKTLFTQELTIPRRVHARYYNVRKEASLIEVAKKEVPLSVLEGAFRTLAKAETASLQKMKRLQDPNVNYLFSVKGEWEENYFKNRQHIITMSNEKIFLRQLERLIKSRKITEGAVDEIHRQVVKSLNPRLDTFSLLILETITLVKAYRTGMKHTLKIPN